MIYFDNICTSCNWHHPAIYYKRMKANNYYLNVPEVEGNK
jgi:hypothetical protein